MKEINFEKKLFSSLPFEEIKQIAVKVEHSLKKNFQDLVFN